MPITSAKSSGRSAPRREGASMSEVTACAIAGAGAAGAPLRAAVNA